MKKFFVFNACFLPDMMPCARRVQIEEDSESEEVREKKK